MIPVRLTIRDFLSYQDPDPIDFTGFQTACLTGDNGAGKSAILDAITWAVFGAARGCEGGQNQDRVVRDGADEALVDFEFALGDSTYRVVRRRTRGGRSDLRFLIDRDGEWTNIAAETLRETEAQIASTLRMDYRTFTASAFFVQGRADDFLARMRPEERKEVFARLLDLGSYERLEEAARSRARDAEVRRAEQARRVEQLDEATRELTTLEAEAAESDRRSGEAAQRLAEASADVERLRVAAADLEKVAARLEAETTALADAERGLAQLTEAVTAKTAEIEELEELLARAAEVRSAIAEAQELGEREREAHERQRQASELEARRAAVVERIEGERKAIESRLRERRREAGALRRRLQETTRLQRELHRAEEALARDGDPGPAIDDTRRSADEQRSIAARAEEQLRAAKAAAAEVDERLSLLTRGDGECPLCGAPLDGVHRRRAERSLRQEAATLTKRRKAAQAALDTARKEAARCAEELRRLHQALDERHKLLRTCETLRARVEEVGSLADDLDTLEAAVTQDAALLEGDAFGADLRAEAEDLARHIREVYDARAHEALRTRLAELEPYAALGGRIEAAAAQRSAVHEERDRLSSCVADAQRALHDRRGVVDGLRARLSDLPNARASLEAAQRVLEDRRREVQQAATDAARLSERLEAVRRAVLDRDAAAEAERASATEHRRFRRLAQAFGRGGIPDLIIDNARPDLEAEANTILGRLSDFEMSVHFEMRRETKSGRARETFDVLVHHDGGLRDFAMFSGGEAFRIAFAVRLALSNLLVRRAGGRLETLVIDEGFGTQDPAGRARLIEAIDLAALEFAKILVITHLDDLKEAFGAQIRVSKDPARGSVVRVVGA